MVRYLGGILNLAAVGDGSCIGGGVEWQREGELCRYATG